MHVVSRKKLLEAGYGRLELEEPLDTWYRTCKRAHWKSIVAVRQELPTADAVGKFTIFNIKGNAFRLITEVNYESQRIFIRHVLTHAEYDKGAWKR